MTAKDGLRWRKLLVKLALKPGTHQADGRAVFVRRPTKFSQYVPHRWLKLVVVCFFTADSTWWIGVGARRSVGPSDHSDLLFSWRTSAWENKTKHRRHFFLHRCRTDVLLVRWVSSVGLMCQGNFGPRRCWREPTLRSAFVATSSSASAWCVPGFSVYTAMMNWTKNSFIFFKCYFFRPQMPMSCKLSILFPIFCWKSCHVNGPDFFFCWTQRRYFLKCLNCFWPYNEIKFKSINQSINLLGKLYI